MLLIVSNIEKDNLYLALAQKKIIWQKKITLLFDEGEKILHLVDKFLQTHKVAPKDIKALIVYQGEGTFTSLRLQAVFANAWAYALKIPIYNLTAAQFKNFNKTLLNLKKLNKFKKIEPAYTSPPKITLPKKK